jgi:hypothetical protein
MIKIRQLIFKKADLLGFLLISVLCCLPGHCAESIPNLGDINGDGDITSVDAAMVLQIVNGSMTPNSSQTSAADADQNGKITASDAEMILYWAVQGLGVNPPSILTEIVEMPVLDSKSAPIGEAGGTITLPSGVTLTIPPGRLTQTETITLKKLDPLDIAAGGDKTCYQITPDVSYLAGATLSVPLASVVGPGANPNALDGVAMDFYDPWTRMNEMRTVDYSLNGGTLSTDLSQIRDGGPSASEDSKVFVFFGKTPSFGEGQAAADAGDIAVKIDVPYYEQGREGYCWAAATIMAINYALGQDKVTQGKKPWDIIDYLNISESAGLSNESFYLGWSYPSYIKMATQVSPYRDFFYSEESLKRFIINTLNGPVKWPIILVFNQEGGGHVLVITGYEITDGNLTLYVHDSDRGMGKRSFSGGGRDITSHQGRFLYYVGVIRPEKAGFQPPNAYALNVLGEKNLGLIFTSPLAVDQNTPFDDGNIRFSWFNPETEKTGFRRNDGKGPAVTAIPKYYGMELNLRVADGRWKPSGNVVGATTLKIETKMIEAGGKIAFEEPNANVTVAREDVVKHVLERDHVSDSGGIYTLSAKIYESGSSQGAGPTDPLDVLSIPDIQLNEGILLTCSLKGQKASLSWTAYPDQADVDGYQIFSRRQNLAWQSLGRVPKDKTTFEADCSDCSETKPAYFAVAVMKEDQVVITSDIVEAKKGEEGDVTIPDPCLGKVLNLHLNNLYQEKNKFWKSDLEKLEAIYWTWINDTETCKINNLSGLEYCINLKRIYFSRHNFTDLSPLENLLKLEKLFVFYTPVSDLNPLTDLINLTYLDMSANDISDISPIKGLVNLNRLLLTENHITDITPIVENPGIGANDEVFLRCNLLGCKKSDITSSNKDWENIYILKNRGVGVDWDCEGWIANCD